MKKVRQKQSGFQYNSLGFGKSSQGQSTDNTIVKKVEMYRCNWGTALSFPKIVEPCRTPFHHWFPN